SPTAARVALFANARAMIRGVSWALAICTATSRMVKTNTMHVNVVLTNAAVSARAPAGPNPNRDHRVASSRRRISGAMAMAPTIHAAGVIHSDALAVRCLVGGRAHAAHRLRLDLRWLDEARDDQGAARPGHGELPAQFQHGRPGSQGATQHRRSGSLPSLHGRPGLHGGAGELVSKARRPAA